MALAALTATNPTDSKPAGHYLWHAGDLRTGKITKTVDLISTRWAVPIGEPGTLEGSFPLRSGEWPTARSDAAAAKSFLAVSYVDGAGDETFLEAGPIWKSKYSYRTGVLQLSAAGLASYFDHRKLIPVLAAGANPAEATVTYDGAQLGLIAKRLVELARAHTGGDLPIVLPDDADLGGPGTERTRTYPGYELGWVGERLNQLSQVDGGPEIQFVPRRRADDPRYLEWVMRIGVEPSMLLTQTGAPWKWFPDVAQSAVQSLDVDTDGTRIGFRQWAAGQGEAEGRPIVYQDATALVDAGWPLLEGEVTALDTVADTSILATYAMAALSYSQRPIEAWTMSVARDSSPSLGRYRPGDWAEIQLIHNDYLPPDTYRMRLLSIAGDATDFVALVFSERLGEV